MKSEKYEVILGLHPTTRGMGWVLATSPVAMVDWGIIHARGDKNAVCLKRISELVSTFSPAVLVMRHPAGSNRKRTKRIQKLVASVLTLARGRGIEVKLFAERDVRSKFERFGTSTREEIAKLLAKNIEALSSRLPPKRKPWKSEDARLGLFDAAALVVAFFVKRDLIADPFATPPTA
jgi:hypothetical protein